MKTASNPRAETLAELLSYWDQEFISRAYWTLLNRAPDDDGGEHYLRQLRNGISKLTILGHLRNSKEGRERDVTLPGLDQALRKHRIAAHAWAGPFVRSFTQLEGNSRRERAHRALLNQLAAIQSMSPIGGQGVGQGNMSQVNLAPRTEVGMVDHLMMRMVRVEAALKRIEDKLKAGSPAKSSVRKL